VSRVLGVIGGMGPAATLAFLERVQALTGAERDQDHIRVIADINPQVPDRNTRRGDAEIVLAEMAIRLRDAGAQVLAMPCNTAHAQAAGIRMAGLPFIDMVAETAGRVARTGAQRIGVLATPGGEALYAEALAVHGLEPVFLQGADRDAFMQLIYGVKRGQIGDAAQQAMESLAAALIAAGADHLLAGCTEVPLLLSSGDTPAPLTDSAEVLAEVCVAQCR
jgi:aspartate racemase